MDLKPKEISSLSSEFQELEQLLETSLRKPFRADMNKIEENPRANINAEGIKWNLDDEILHLPPTDNLWTHMKFFYHRSYPRLVLFFSLYLITIFSFLRNHFY